MFLAPSPARTEKGGGATAYAGSLIPLGQPRLDTGSVPPSGQGLAAGAAGKDKGPRGHPPRLFHPSPHDLLQDTTRNQLPTPPSRKAPRAPPLGVGACRAITVPRTSKWRPRLDDDRKRLLGVKGSRRRARTGEGGGGGGAGAAGERVRGASGVRGARGGCGGRRAHLPLVSAAIADHMTEAVAGMTAWALATRGGDPRRWRGRG